MYLISWTLFAKQVMPPHWRGSHKESILNTLLAPLNDSYRNFLNYKREVKRDININAQNGVLQGHLNRKYAQEGLRNIEFKDGNNPGEVEVLIGRKYLPHQAAIEREISQFKPAGVSFVIVVKDSHDSEAKAFFIPDDSFRAYLKRLIPGAMLGNKLITTDAAVAEMHTILVDNTNIRSLAGLSFFENLQRLNISNTQIPTLDVSVYPQLEVLICARTPLTALDLSNNKKLMVLDCSATQLSSLDIRGMRSAQSRLNMKNLESTLRLLKIHYDMSNHKEVKTTLARYQGRGLRVETYSGGVGSQPYRLVSTITL